PEYSLGRLLISHASAPELTLYDLDTSSLAGRIPFAARAQLEAGASGRYGYAFDPAQGVLHAVDPGQWLLSHIDHFHIVRGEHQLMTEQLRMPQLSSLLVSDGWVAAYDASAGAASFFQERSITARSFAPTMIALRPAVNRGVAIVARAQLIASDGTQLSQRPVIDPAVARSQFPGCSEARGAAAQGERVFVACAEGVLQLTWDSAQEVFVPQLLVTSEPVQAVRTTARFEGALAQLGARGLWLLSGTGAPPRTVELASDIAAFELRRQGETAIVLTLDGSAHELELHDGRIVRSTPVPVAAHTRVALSHAFAYLSDPAAPRVLVLRLRTLQLEPELAIPAPAHDLTLVGVPSSYTDERE
ncbi:MAG TPA: hypothetical protein VFX59_29370, partial [Polyangiales bacterium]|nr:hypothetical protein [Polyangiales bacterium]